jgi:hypothetical protein
MINTENNNTEQENQDLINFYNKILKLDSTQNDKSIDNKYDFLSNLFLYLLSHLQDIFYSKYEKDFYEIYADIISFIKNPNCSCRSKIINYVKNNKESIQKIILEWLSTTKFDNNIHNKLIKILNKIDIEIESYNTYLKYKGEPKEEEALGKSMIGKVVTIDNSPEAYYNFINYLRINSLFYSGLNIVEKENKLTIYFY